MKKLKRLKELIGNRAVYFAMDMECTRQHIYGIMKGKSPSVKFIEKFCDKYKVDTGIFFE